MTINILSLGAGVQSSTLLYLSHKGWIPPYDKIYFADTGDEPQAVYEHLEYLKTLADIETVKKVDGKSLSDHIYAATGRFFLLPLYVVLNGQVSILKRQCTNEFKVQPIDHAIRHMLLGEDYEMAYTDKIGRVRVKRGVQVNMHLGISLDEKRRVSQSWVGWKKHQYPLIELGMTRHDCVVFCHKHDYLLPPKSSCVYCPYHTDDYWRTLAEIDLQEAIRLDDYVRTDEFRGKTKIKGDLYIHSSCRPLRDVASEGFKTGKQLPIQLSFASELLEITCKSDGGFSCFS